MNKPNVLTVVLLAIAMAAATWIAGWWGVPVVASAYAFVGRPANQPSRASIGAALAWAGLLAFDASRGALASFTGTLQAFLGRLAPALLLVTILFPVLLAWSAATIVVEIRRRGSTLSS